MKKVNKAGSALLETLESPQHLNRAALDDLLAAGALIIDMRSRDAFAQAYVPGAINIPADSNFNTYVGWFVDYDAPLYFITPDQGTVDDILAGLRAIGVDNVPGYFTPDVLRAKQTETLPLFTVAELVERMKENDLVILDVRNKTEYEEKHIRGAKHITLGYLPDHLDELPRDRLIVVHCASGYRSQIAASLLRRYGFPNVANLNDNTAAWSKALPTE
jgi:hydroxyacylglutathione hydrolase